MNPRNLAPMAIACLLTLVLLASSAFAGDISIPSPTLYNQLETFHGHVCAVSIFGARLGLAAKEALKAAGGTGKVVATYYDLSCPVDGIQVAAGTTYGNKALTVIDRDEHRLVLTAEGNKRSVEVRLTKKAEELGLKSRDLGKKIKSLPAGSQERLTLEREVDDIYGWLKTAPTTEVVSVVTINGTKSR